MQVDRMTKNASLDDVLKLVATALSEVGAQHATWQIERLGVMVHEAMSLDTRHYHDLTHAVSVAQQGDAIEIFAGLFHDVVYHHVDKLFAPSLAPLIESLVEFDDGGVQLCAGACDEDHWAQVALKVFGITPEQAPSLSAGLNELLSAIVAAKALQTLLEDSQIVQIVACIEATIPFRKPDENGKTAIEALAQRLSQVSDQYALGLSEDSVSDCMIRAVNVSNKDLSSFAREDSREFLAETWLLFAESSAVLGRKRGFFMGDYSASLSGALGFFTTLNAHNVFQRFGQYPATPVHEDLERALQDNLAWGVVYLKMKIIAIALLEGLAQMTGGDTLVTLFMGQVRLADEKGKRFEDFLPVSQDASPQSATRDSGGDSMTYELLAHGRAAISRFDMPNSPLAAFLYARLGEAEMLRLYPFAASSLAQEISPKLYLAEIPKALLLDVVRACQRIAWTRKEQLRQVLRELG